MSQLPHLHEASAHHADASRPSAPAASTAAGRVVIVSASVGAGHDGAAAQLALRLAGSGHTVDRWDFLDLVPAGLGPLVSECYRRLLTIAPSAYQRIYSSTESTGRPGALIRLIQRSTHRKLLRALPPDTRAVVATYPIAGQVLGNLRSRGRLAVPAAVYLTDFSVHPLWVAPGVDLHLAAHPVPAEQARAHGAERVAVAGPVVDSRFTPTTEALRTAARDRFGLPPGAPLALLVAGSWGVGEVARVAAEVRATGAAVPVVVCGKNRALAERLRADGVEHAFGWVRDMPGLMHACDVLVQNAGGLTSLEAFACGLPVVSYRCIPGHGLTNAAALDQAGLAPWVRDPAELAAVLTAMVDGPTGRRYREAGLALHRDASGPAEAIAAIAAGSSGAVRAAGGSPGVPGSAPSPALPDSGSAPAVPDSAASPAVPADAAPPVHAGPPPLIPAQRRRPDREAIPTRASAPTPRRPDRSPDRRPGRRVGLAVAALSATAWLSTAGTQLAVAYGGFDAVDAGRTGRAFLVVHPPHGGHLDDATLRALSAVQAAVSVDTDEAAADPAEVRRFAAAGLTLVNAGYGPPYQSGIVTRRDSVEAGADALRSATGAGSSFFLSSRDVDALDLGLAAYHREHLVVPDLRIACGSAVTPQLRPGQIVLVECGSADPARLTTTMNRLLTSHRPPRLGALNSLS
ncbi:glycosyltransferase [Kitasatospora sp. NPDC059160]|uniref:MGDG synthase family glycosyltransferase n=1 Tax=Kitasatospora sp. NPDC059160 TaxID=3346748 RepID=UPI0036A3F161